MNVNWRCFSLCMSILDGQCLSNIPWRCISLQPRGSNVVDGFISLGKGHWCYGKGQGLLLGVHFGTWGLTPRHFSAAFPCSCLERKKTYLSLGLGRTMFCFMHVPTWLLAFWSFLIMFDPSPTTGTFQIGRFPLRRWRHNWWSNWKSWCHLMYLGSFPPESIMKRWIWWETNTVHAGQK